MPADGLYEILDDRFRTERCANGDSRLEVLHDDCRWAEGPLYLPAWRQLIWSDIPNDRILRWDEATGTVGVFRTPAGHSNGNTLDRQGRLVTCEQGNRRVTRTEADGTVTVLADRYAGKRLNSPNDSVVRSDGTIWFSDPDFGITSDYEGHRAESEIGACNVYRIDPATGDVHLAADGFAGPNGVILSPDEKRLYVSDSRTARIQMFDIREDGTLSDGKVFAEGRGNVRFDNIRFDDEGRLWAAALDDSVHCYHPDGTLIGRLRVPEPVSNIAFGGPKNNRLFITATTSLYSLVMSVTGAPRL
ncbi:MULTISPECIES: SMP-30/gluconolactonase/LRE family protein [unclassified Streptomyces]|uniref:SMP-30/gluconolactonase/LRE family protein n=1 Tax=unclassified Streptomyces TaxID=2593676 RepID=UPI002DDAEA92|nr:MULTISPECIES: SMP-30/gluconolactonase/LRE family protein [unclassified Streptomyces]WSC48853.1 SMP-30/gluconolactonase/LRE family protein [Streptomyces sp. NBC_01762]WSD30370.1 SMP-30/gluconolactonase/LRE family protein [Streptomyces sp. NBC_01751]WSJ56044.1 SMP-30/gluconolactonase/LRE family protein [Streptomyces sp. NBC_01318]